MAFQTINFVNLALIKTKGEEVEQTTPDLFAF